MLLPLLLAAMQVVPAPAAPTPPPTQTAPSSPTSMVAPAALMQPNPATVRVAITTTAGPIVLELEKERAPITTANFLRYVDARRLDGIEFFRSMRLAWGPGLVQAGQHQVARLYPPIKHEPTTQTGLSHTDGAISMGRMAVGTARADFTIAIGDMTGLDAKPGQTGDNAGYAVFGRVVEGMDVVKRIWMSPRDPNAGVGAMKGEMLKPPVKVLTVRRVG